MFEAFGGCFAAFLPELRRGFPLTNVYDHLIFPSPPEEASQWEIDHGSKKIQLPRPVARLRVWNAGGNDYQFEDCISAHMTGAPSVEDRDAYWVEFLNELRANLNPKYGPDFVDDCITLAPEVIKEKYGF